MILGTGRVRHDITPLLAQFIELVDLPRIKREDPAEYDLIMREMRKELAGVH